jgi:hypothetical protein
MPVKAKAPSLAYPTGSGFYYGLGAGGETAKVQTSTADALAGGAIANLVAGYTFTLANGQWLAGQATVSASNMSADPACNISCQFKSHVSGKVEVKYGVDFGTLNAILPNIGSIFAGLPLMPVGTDNPLTSPYVSAGVHFSQDEVAAAGGHSAQSTVARGIVGVGLLTRKNNGTAIDTYINYATVGTTLLPGCMPGQFNIAVGQKIQAGVNIYFGTGN